MWRRNQDEIGVPQPTDIDQPSRVGSHEEHASVSGDVKQSQG